MATEKKAEVGDKIVHLSDTVMFTASYPKDFKGQKVMTEGKQYKLHRLHAQRLVEKKLGSITGNAPGNPAKK